MENYKDTLPSVSQDKIKMKLLQAYFGILSQVSSYRRVEYTGKPCIPHTEYLSDIKHSHCTHGEVGGTVIITETEAHIFKYSYSFIVFPLFIFFLRQESHIF